MDSEKPAQILCIFDCCYESTSGAVIGGSKKAHQCRNWWGLVYLFLIKTTNSQTRHVFFTKYDVCRIEQVKGDFYLFRVHHKNRHNVIIVPS